MPKDCSINAIRANRRAEKLLSFVLLGNYRPEALSTFNCCRVAYEVYRENWKREVNGQVPTIYENSVVAPWRGGGL